MRIDGEPPDHPGELLIMLNKPAGRVCSHDSAEGPSIYGLLPERWQRRNPPVTSVGRLDKDTTGLLLLTDSSQLVHRLTSPKHKVPKVYRATLDRDLPAGYRGASSRAAACSFRTRTLPCAPASLSRLGDARGRGHPDRGPLPSGEANVRQPGMQCRRSSTAAASAASSLGTCLVESGSSCRSIAWTMS